MSRATHVNQSVSAYWPFLCALIVVVLLAVGATFHYMSDGESLWILGLFILPCIFQLLGLKLLWNRVNGSFYLFYTRATTICIIGYGVLWIIYSTHWRAYEIFSYIALVLIGGLLVIVAMLTAAIMRSMLIDPAGKWYRLSGDFRDGVLHHPLWGVSLFFILFLGVTYLFGFALAFHDQYSLLNGSKVPALHMANLDSPDDWEDKNKNPSNKDGAQASQQGTQAPIPTPSPQGEKYYFYFNLGEARVNREDYAECTPQQPLKQGGQVLTGLQLNDCNIKAIAQRIADGTSGGNRLRIILIGHGDDAQVDSGAKHYKSNYELSEARAQNVSFAIQEALQDDKSWHNIEWIILPLSNEPIPQIENNSTAEEKRVVIASIQPIKEHLTALQMHQSKNRPMKLMDYMYFSIYTITTTGYGDIIPTTAYAKFVASLANICEVLFLVVFFNALISLKGVYDPDDPAGASRLPRDDQQQPDEMARRVVNMPGR